MCDGLIGWIGTLINAENRWSLSAGLGYLVLSVRSLDGHARG